MIGHRREASPRTPANHGPVTSGRRRRSRRSGDDFCELSGGLDLRHSSLIAGTIVEVHSSRCGSTSSAVTSITGVPRWAAYTLTCAELGSNGAARCPGGRFPPDHQTRAPTALNCKGSAPQNSMRAPSSTTRVGGMLKKSVAALAFRDMRLNSRFRHRIIGAGPVDKSSARPR